MMKCSVIFFVGLLAGALSVSAQTVAVTVDGNTYAVTTITDTDANQTALLTALLTAQSWYGDYTLADDVATAVGGSLGGQQPASAFNGAPYGPFFLFEIDNGETVMAIDNSGIVGNYSLGGGVTVPVTYAIATIIAPVPESSINPGLMAAAGLFIGWRSWRTVRAARA
jgi:hypothetical protein